MAKTPVMIRLSDEQLAKVDAAAAVLHRTRANVCLLALADYLEMVDEAHAEAERTVGWREYVERSGRSAADIVKRGMR